ncbi:MAG: proteasome accessory factor PafA2 family protein [Pirellulaceae bacterium]|nr:proteasome accessory factor PafA2 family protein [Pirellulaceae bacterium]MDP6557102.1 proteasome accessory factor PafA2 family protein [Pirellulaceae bacterium]
MSNVFQRLVGLETEYAIRFHSDDSETARSKFRLYEALIGSLCRRVLAVPAKHFKEGVFTANGGAVWFEAERPAAGGGLVEGATPECRGPREALTYQRAQDRLLAESAKSAVTNGQMVLIKNDRDGHDNVYGAQENYEATIASGWQLFFWRAGLVVMFPLAVLTWIGILLSVFVTISYFAVAALCYLPFQLLTGGRHSVALFLFGSDLVEGRETCIHVPAWLETTLQFGTRMLTAPLALYLYVLIQATGFRRARRQLLPFLISRPVIAGAGMIDRDGTFHVADKGPAINCVTGFGGMVYDRPVFSMGHFFKAVYTDSWFAPRNYLTLFAQRQRLQLAIGDSNMCDAAEYLRVGTTMLVLDAIESGAIRNPPRLIGPICALHRVCADPTLTAELGLSDGSKTTALGLQRFYFEVCRAFLAKQVDDVPEEAEEIIQLWEQALSSLEEMSRSAATSLSMFGSLDWVTKKYLIDKAGQGATWEEKKKIDIRYHELSPEGYHQLLVPAGMASVLVTNEEIDRARRSAPANSPATTRGHYIREFADGDEPVRANWQHVVIGRGWGAKVVRLARFGRAAKDTRRDGRHQSNVRTDGLHLD